jgi:hypothetical protein
MLLFAAFACTTAGYSYRSSVQETLGDTSSSHDGTSSGEGYTAYTEPEDEDEEPADAEVPRVLINEVVARNDSTWAGDDAGWPDWVELYNASEAPVALSDLSLKDRSDLPWRGGEGELLPGERLVVAADDRLEPGGLHAPFALDGEDERLVLSVAGRVADRLALGVVDDDVAWARLPDGGAWFPTIETTPNAENPSVRGASLEPTDLVFQLNEVLPVDIQLSAAALSSLRSSRLTYVEGALTVPEGDWGTVNVKLKSYVGSSRTIDQKCAFKLDLNDYHGREWHGLGKLTLNNMVQDNTYVHEWAAYELFRAMGVPSPRVAYGRVGVNGTDYGLYLIVESIDREFLARWYTDATGNLYEGAYGVDLYDSHVASFDYKGGDGVSDRSDLQELVDILDDGATEANYTRVQTVMDMDEFLANMAVEALTMHWDGYSTANNYRLYKDPGSGRFQIIPWGTDQTFITAYFTAWTGRGRLFQWCLEVGSCSDRYDEILLDATYTMEALDLGTRITEIESALRDDIDTDPRREFTVATHDYYLAYTVANMATYPQTVRDQLSAR